MTDNAVSKSITGVAEYKNSTREKTFPGIATGSENIVNDFMIHVFMISDYEIVNNVSVFHELDLVHVYMNSSYDTRERIFLQCIKMNL